MYMYIIPMYSFMYSVPNMFSVFKGLTIYITYVSIIFIRQIWYSGTFYYGLSSLLHASLSDFIYWFIVWSKLQQLYYCVSMSPSDIKTHQVAVQTAVLHSKQLYLYQTNILNGNVTQLWLNNTFVIHANHVTQILKYSSLENLSQVQPPRSLVS